MTEPPPLRGPSTATRVVAVEGDRVVRRRDRLATEEPLEIRVAGPGQVATSVSVTMRTPGADFELAAGFLRTEGLLASPEEIAAIRYCDDVDREEQRYNIVTVHLRRPFDGSGLQRNFYMTSSCGVCGKAAIDQIAVSCPVVTAELVVTAATIAGLDATLRAGQRTFDRTGGLHATGLFDATGTLLTLREDVGRHNAMDKAIGERFLLGRTPLESVVALVSGRSSFELVQKAAVAGIPVLCAVGAPSSLAVEAAEQLGVTLVGFVRDGRFNVYAHAERIALPGSERAAS
jgi:FdhD protein